MVHIHALFDKKLGCDALHAVEVSGAMAERDTENPTEERTLAWSRVAEHAWVEVKAGDGLRGRSTIKPSTKLDHILRGLSVWCILVGLAEDRAPKPSEELLAVRAILGALGLPSPSPGGR